MIGSGIGTKWSVLPCQFARSKTGTVKCMVFCFLVICTLTPGTSGSRAKIKLQYYSGNDDSQKDRWNNECVNETTEENQDFCPYTLLLIISCEFEIRT